MQAAPPAYLRRSFVLDRLNRTTVRHDGTQMLWRDAAHRTFRRASHITLDARLLHRDACRSPKHLPLSNRALACHSSPTISRDNSQTYPSRTRGTLAHSVLTSHMSYVCVRIIRPSSPVRTALAGTMATALGGITACGGE